MCSMSVTPHFDEGFDERPKRYGYCGDDDDQDADGRLGDVHSVISHG